MIRAHKIRLNPTAEQGNYFARAVPNITFCVELGARRVEPKVRGRREAHGVEAQKAVQRDQTGAVSLDGGRVTKNASDQRIDSPKIGSPHGMVRRFGDC